MPEISHSRPVTGTVVIDSEGTMLVLSERLDGYDTFLNGKLQFGEAPPMGVRILTLDDVTVLRLLDQSLIHLTDPWTGILHLPHGWRARSIPDDLMVAAEKAYRELAALDEAELRYALTFLSEASTDTIRQARIEAIVNALPRSDLAS